jgi:hypothetical protein
MLFQVFQLFGDGFLLKYIGHVILAINPGTNGKQNGQKEA